ncbi:DEAD/DEAH box helicase [Massilia sp. YIM B02769]|uniref:DEAD/DEAH box helicase n=1 Tax=Massilia sp. YIM B02769 TaxID=3050129 RepID=UPI0025B6880A|nr:DEAD/DEAH box helicase [Massilia sp. YIM B02769]MDN4059803.1 DEAD/DEAH box helicase [Massilia sp. YIM B02769]
MHFTYDDVKRQFDSGTFRRGEGYALEGRVLAARDAGERIEGEVGGSGGTIYRQTVRFREDPRGFRFEGSCSCPIAYNCKHVVAVLLASLEQQEQGPALPMAAEYWLQQMASLQAAPAPAAARPGPTSRLGYVMVPDPQGGEPCLNLCKLRLRPDGSIGGTTLHNDPYGLVMAPPAHVAPDDEDMVRLIIGQSLGNMRAGGFKPEGRLGARVLEQLCEDGKLFWADTLAGLRAGRLYGIRPGPQRDVTLGWHPDTPGSEALALAWRFDDGAGPGAILPTEPLLYLDDGILGRLTLPKALAALPAGPLLDLVARTPTLHADERAGMALRLAELGLDHTLPLPQELALKQRRDIAPVPCLLLNSEPETRRRERIWHDYAQLSFEYDGLSTMDEEGPVFRRVVDGGVELIERDPEAEAAAGARLAGLGFAPPRPGSPLDDIEQSLCLPTEQAWLHFARHDLPRLRAAGWQIEFDGNYRYDIADVQDWYADLNEEGEGNPWFALELGIVVDGRRHALLPLLLEMIRTAPADFTPAALEAHKDAAEIVLDLGGDTRVALPWQRIKPILSTLGELYFAERIDAALRLPFTDAARLAELEAAAQMRWLGGERLLELGRKLHDFAGIAPVPAPQGLQAQLREYQQAGLAWMQFLREYGFGGILADDMGLGKTIQTLAHILAEKEAGRLDAPALVVAPTSLMGNWQAEAARFAPGLRVLLLHGKDRAAQFAHIAEADLVLTTYPLLGRDEAALRAHKYHLLILDESQYIKNHRSRAAQAACLLDARHRLCLTGTPLQNHLGELWSQFHFLMPGLLGDDKSFRARFRKPIEQGGDVRRQELLMRRVKPFMLRRTKDKVATELPPKTEVVVQVDFGAAQGDLYETVRVAMDRKVREEIGRKGLARSQIVILDALLKLRQVCCDPRLLRQNSAAGSAKLDTLMDLLDTLLAEGRKVLVFSQFTSMLALIEAELQPRSVDYALLTGDTVDRATPVAAFQGGQVSVFLISLKAGGVGLNLTAADTVIHYDPWWNPASENQATDRAWRIGQTQPVFVYKLIARGTLEEKIQTLQRRKGELAAAVLDAEGGLAPGLGAEDLQAIFAQPAD